MLIVCQVVRAKVAACPIIGCIRKKKTSRVTRLVNKLWEPSPPTQIYWMTLQETSIIRWYWTWTGLFWITRGDRHKLLNWKHRTMQCSSIKQQVGWIALTLTTRPLKIYVMVLAGSIVLTPTALPPSKTYVTTREVHHRPISDKAVKSSSLRSAKACQAWSQTRTRMTHWSWIDWQQVNIR